MSATILIAEDDEGTRDILQMLLEKEGYKLDIRSNGEELLKGQFVPPDIFLIDKQLSGVNGLDICRYLKTQSHTSHIPVIMVSASPDIGPLSQTAGADDYLEKPFDINCLLRMIKDHLQKVNAAGARH